MLKRELKITRKNLFIWTTICILLFGIAYIIYPTIVKNDNADMLNQMLDVLPPEMLKMFNMDIANISSVFGWFKTEGYVFLMLIIGFFSALLGSNILVKEESDKTIEFLYSKPITRNKIIKSKLLTGLINITLCVLIVLIFNLVGMYLSNDLEMKSFILLSISPIFVCIPLFCISLYISTFFNKTKKTYSLGLGITFIAYFIQMLSSMSESVEFLKYFSLFSLADSRNIIINGNLNMICIIISIIISIVTIILTYIRYNKKELV